MLVKPRCEDFAHRQLVERGVLAYLPRLGLQRHGETLVRPMFPGYLFARLVLSRDGARVGWTPGVRRLVTFDGEAPTVPDAAITVLREQTGPDGITIVWTRAG